jgi:hypothetical protein
MGNLDQPPFCSIHLYGSYDHNGEITGDSRIYDLFEGSTQRTTGGVFFCLPEEHINGRDRGVQSDYATLLRHHVEMLKRIDRILPLQEDHEFWLEKGRAIYAEILAPEQQDWFQKDLNALRDEDGKIRDLHQWRTVWHEVNVAAEYKARFQERYG